jgi:hypothetical protein
MKPLEPTEFAEKDVFGCSKNTYQLWLSILEQQLTRTEAVAFIETALKPCLNLVSVTEQENAASCMTAALQWLINLLTDKSDLNTPQRYQVR